MKHAILGAGGVGGLLAAALASAGEDVVLLVRWRPRGKAIQPIRLERPHESIEIPVKVETNLTVPVDVLWVAVKTHHLVTALRVISPTVEIGSIVPLLNGIEHIPLLRSRFTHEQVIPATILVSSERISPGRIVQYSPFARIAISTVAERTWGSVMARLQSVGLSFEFTTDEKTMLWRKLALLAPLALTGAASGLDKEGVFAHTFWRERLESALDEVCSVALADGATVERSEILTGIRGMPPGMRSSLQKDVWSRVASELDGIGGAIVRIGRQNKIDTPVVRELVAEIEELVRTGVPS